MEKNKMIVLVTRIKDDYSGVIEIYRVDKQKFEKILNSINPVTETEWYNVVSWLEENAKLVKRVKPDFTITIWD